MTVAWTDPAEALPSLASLSGLDYLRRVRDGRLPAPPIAQVFGMRFDEIEDGRFSVTCDPREAFFNPLGTVHGGLACTMLDTALGCVAHSTLPAGSGYTSIDIAVSYLRPILPTAGPLTATGTVVKRGRRVVFAEAALTDAAGVSYASATSSLLVVTPNP
jgi:uncharacterized protein (TIGR00369 family)